MKINECGPVMKEYPGVPDFCFYYSWLQWKCLQDPILSYELQSTEYSRKSELIHLWKETLGNDWNIRLLNSVHAQGIWHPDQRWI